MTFANISVYVIIYVIVIVFLLMKHIMPQLPRATDQVWIQEAAFCTVVFWV
jgi:hypothetical protein